MSTLDDVVTVARRSLLVMVVVAAWQLVVVVIGDKISQTTCIYVTDLLHNNLCVKTRLLSGES